LLDILAFKLQLFASHNQVPQVWDYNLKNSNTFPGLVRRPFLVASQTYFDVFFIHAKRWCSGKFGIVGMLIVMASVGM